MKINLRAMPKKIEKNNNNIVNNNSCLRNMFNKDVDDDIDVLRVQNPRITIDDYKNLMFFNKISSSYINPKIINNWCKLENLLYIFFFFFKYTNIEDPSFQKVLIIFQYIFDVPQEFTQIIRTVTEIMDNCSGIISDSKDLVIKGFQYLIKGLDNNLITKYC